MGKYAALVDRVRALEPEGLRIEAAQAADDATLATVHDLGYVQAVQQGTLPAGAQREIGLPWSPALVQRARRSVGATVAAAQAAMREGLACNLAGGTPHAKAAAGGGFCIFNDVAVAARVLQQTWPRQVKRVAVVDLDVHQGNGTADIFA
ncbi:MAG: histone deacetylase, partial [Burkholderiaceae bacterium]